MDPKDVYMSKPWLKFYPEGVPQEVDSSRNIRTGCV